jgi:hypothetical protein
VNALFDRRIIQSSFVMKSDPLILVCVFSGIFNSEPAIKNGRDRLSERSGEWDENAGANEKAYKSDHGRWFTPHSRGHLGMTRLPVAAQTNREAHTA